MTTPERFRRTEQLLGPAALATLAKSRVAVVGLGAVGSYAVEALARAGIGFLRLVDFDVIRHSNFNRQLYALEPNLGRPKAEVARERVLQINPACEVEARSVFVDAATAPGLLQPAVDVLVDAIDSVGPKVALLAAAKAAGCPVVSSMGAATRLDPDLVRVADIADTTECPLARFIRKRLRRLGIETGITCIFSLEPARQSRPPALTEDETLPRGRPRRPIGSLSYMTGIFGLRAAHEVLRLLLPDLQAQAPQDPQIAG
jgi:tRNA A37 threonylcarbamoyladenosine dehydratase